MSTIAIQDALFTRLEQEAQARQVSPNELAEQILRDHLRANAQEQMRQEMLAFQSQHSALLEKYSGMFIAMYGGQVVDYDADPVALALRIDDQFPNAPVLVTQVKPEAEQVYKIRSPRITLL